jgi:predicted O-linked N-acetylglucosamine transferase (SPINDLY family)
MWRHEEAIWNFEKAIELKPIFAEAFQGRGTSLSQLKRLEAAIESFSQALALNPRQKFIPGMRRYIQMQICDWMDFDADVQRLRRDTQEGIPVCSPFAILALTDDPRLHRLAAELWIRSECPSSSALGPIGVRGRGDKIRIGYFSADFRMHPVAQVTAELFEQHDRDRFEFIAFSLGPSVHDDMRARLERCFDRFIDVRDQSDLEVASLARQMEVDVAVDLSGHTEHSRTKIFAFRAAPIQINYLGYPGTMGAEFIDYMIADRTVVPVAQQSLYSEKIIYLPDCYLPSDSLPPVESSPFLRKQLGLPENRFVFCCFNHVGKLLPRTFDSWMRVLKRVEGSVLWLAHSNPVAAANLRREAAKRGIAAERLIFATRIDSMAEHRARLGHADLFLDTSPYNAHVTAHDALWAGLPILTLIGEAFAGRVAASLLNAVGLPELIATTQQQYEDLAVSLAENPDRMTEIRAKLLHNRTNTRVFDIRRFTANLEAAYAAAFDRHLRGQPPDHIYLES